MRGAAYSAAPRAFSITRRDGLQPNGWDVLPSAGRHPAGIAFQRDAGTSGTGNRFMPPFTPRNPCQTVTISDKQRPSSGHVRAGQRKDPTTDEKAQTMTVGKRGRSTGTVHQSPSPPGSALFNG